ncbi:hypothetical protein CU044_5390 [Streptomyces sp. L-9-10]|nr:hypothetical protein CU044_5390 [Streptomyces sp. L-9-10]
MTVLFRSPVYRVHGGKLPRSWRAMPPGLTRPSVASGAGVCVHGSVNRQTAEP